MARPATGSPRWNAKDERWEARVTLIGGERKPVVMAAIAPCANGTPLADAPRDCEPRMAKQMATMLKTMNQRTSARVDTCQR